MSNLFENCRFMEDYKSKQPINEGILGAAAAIVLGPIAFFTLIIAASCACAKIRNASAEKLINRCLKKAATLNENINQIRENTTCRVVNANEFAKVSQCNDKDKKIINDNNCACAVMYKGETPVAYGIFVIDGNNSSVGFTIIDKSIAKDADSKKYVYATIEYTLGVVGDNVNYITKQYASKTVDQRNIRRKYDTRNTSSKVDITKSEYNQIMSDYKKACKQLDNAIKQVYPGCVIIDNDDEGCNGVVDKKAKEALDKLYNSPSDACANKNKDYDKIFKDGVKAIMDKDKMEKVKELVELPKYTTIDFYESTNDTYPAVAIELSFTKEFRIA